MAINGRTDQYPTSSERRGNDSFDPLFNMNLIEGLEYDGVNLKRQVSPQVTTLIDYVGGSNPIYIGIATPGTATSTSLWQIKKLSFDSNNNCTGIAWADGDTDFNNIWDNRASLSYS